MSPSLAPLQNNYFVGRVIGELMQRMSDDDAKDSIGPSVPLVYPCRLTPLVRWRFIAWADTVLTAVAGVRNAAHAPQ